MSSSKHAKWIFCAFAWIVAQAPRALAEPCSGDAIALSPQAAELADAGAQIQEATAAEGEKLHEWSLNDKDVADAPCRNPIPSDQEILKWLANYSKASPKGLSLQNVRFENEDPRMVAHLKELISRDDQFQIDLKERDDLDQCKTAVCVSQKVFGERTGPRLLYLMAKHGINGSHLSFTESSAWQEGELEPVLAALSDLPPALAEGFFKNKQMTHATRGTAPFGDLFGQTVADSSIRVFDTWNKQADRHRVSGLYHEIGHEVSRRFGLAQSPEWLELSGWKNDSQWKSTQPDALLSEYGKQDPGEDFAEAFVAYRYNPEWLKKRSPKKFAFMKEVVFDGLEYTSAESCASGNSRAKRFNAAASAAVRDPGQRAQLINPEVLSYRCEKAAIKGAAENGDRISRELFERCVSAQLSAKFRERQSTEFKYPRLTLETAAVADKNFKLDVSSYATDISAAMGSLKQKIAQAFTDRFSPVFKNYSAKEDPQGYYCYHFHGGRTVGSPRYDRNNSSLPLYYPDRESQTSVEGILRKVCLTLLESKKSEGMFTSQELDRAVNSVIEAGASVPSPTRSEAQSPVAVPVPVPVAPAPPTVAPAKPATSTPPARPSTRDRKQPPARSSLGVSVTPSYVAPSTGAEVKTKVCVTRSYLFGAINSKSGDCD